MGMKHWRRLAGAWMLLPMVAWAQQGGSHAGWWDQAKAGAPAAAQQSDGAGVAEDPAALPEPSGAVVPLDRATLAYFECVEVRRFETTSGGFIASKEEARAATIPAGRLLEIQRSVAGQVPEKARGLRSTLVGEGWPACPDPARALVLGGRLVDYKAGNQALRYFVGFGAGAQKFAVDVWLARKSDGSLVAREEVVDRKVGGWIGGQDEKGLEDFAEKVAGFVRDSLRPDSP